MAAIQPPSLLPTEPHFLHVDTLAEPPIDLSVFSHYLPNSIVRHRLMQSWTMRKFEHLENQITSTSSILLQISCSKDEAELFKPLLLLSKKVRNIFIERNSLTIHLNQRPDEEHPPAAPNEYKKNKYHKTPVCSYSIYFPPLDTAGYAIAFQNALQQISEAIEERTSHFNLYLHGIDCLFISYLLQHLCSFCLEHIKLRPNYALQIQIKKMAFEERQKALLQLKTLFAVQDVSEELPTEIKTVHFADGETTPRSKEEKQNSPKTAFVSASAALALFCLPLDTLLENETLENKIHCLASTYLAYRLQDLPLHKKPKKEKWDILWLETQKYLPNVVFSIDKKTQIEIQKLTLLKHILEQKIFLPTVDIRPAWLIDLFQVNRALFPSDSSVPLVSIWIDDLPLQIDAAESLQEDVSLIYYRSLFRALANSQGFFDTDYRSLAYTLRYIREDEIPDIKTPNPKFLLLMLQASSFSFFSHANSSILDITRALHKNYKIKYMQPQKNPTCEFFTPAPGNFTIIRTALYLILQKEKEKGEFVVKWKVSFSNGQWSFSIQIPSIYLNGSNSPKEQEEIYEGFDLGKTDE